MVGRGGKDRGIKIRGKKRRLVLCPNKNRMGFCIPFRNHRHARQHEMLDPRNTVSATVHERMTDPPNAHSVQGAKQREGEPLCLAQRHDSMQMNARNLKM